MSLLSDLIHFREQAARREGVESFKVLSKATIDAIALVRPKNKEELTQIKGIKEAKYRKYGQAILALVAAHTIGADVGSPDEELEKEEPGVPPTLSVNDFLESLNTELSGMAGRVQGEVTDITVWQERMVFFTLKDKEAESVLKCSMSYSHYALSGAQVTIGTEVIAEGYPKIYKPRGELSFQVLTLELFGEGALKKAYDELYKKLEAGGAFDEAKKKPLPLFPERIALITSLEGAALGDFQTNIGRFGLKIDLYPSGVEGSRAIHELLAALKAVSRKADQYDVLVIIRGGGSLESLAAFNNEALITAVRALPLPVLSGIGHERDITLTALVSDRMESTPTACALSLTSYWESARESIYVFSQKLPRLLETSIYEKKEALSDLHHALYLALHSLKNTAQKCEQAFLFWVQELQRKQEEKKKALERVKSELTAKMEVLIEEGKKTVDVFEQYLAQVDPRRVLALGYSIVRKEGKVLTSVKGLVPGDILSIRLGEGRLRASVKEID